MSAGPYAIGSDHYPGLGKVVEEFGEALQVLGKMIATNGEPEHWDGTDLRDRLHEEFGDVMGAMAFAGERWGLDFPRMLNRAEDKRLLFEQWQREQGS